ncbi:hypothetical protein Q1695_011501 [Nippostrongylus brasiliensis]|nr:hypothetical protein Q1695_011501 [Nippostrongylus brasiliensis]
MLPIFLLLPLVAFAKDTIESRSSSVQLLENFSNLSSVLDALPKECTKNGKKYKEGEDFQIGHLRYKCQKYGVYSIEGCITEKKKNLKLGEIVVIDNVKSQCLSKGNSVFYRETVCGIMGQPECDKIDEPSGFKAAKDEPKSNQPEVNIPGLPTGWKVLEQGRQEIPGSNGAHVVSRTLVFMPMAGSRARRQTGRGIGSVVGIVDVGTDKPPMPMSMLLNGGKAPATGGKVKCPTVHPVAATLNIKDTGNKRVFGIGRDDRVLNSRSPTATNTQGLRPDSVGGSRSDVNWKGKTISVNGQTIAAGPGTFTFGTSPTGAFIKKDN